MNTLSVTLIQSNLHWENKTANLQLFEEKIASHKQPAQVVVLPEMFSTGFSMKPAELAETMDGPSVQWMKRIAAENKIILTGSLIIEANQQYYNRLLWVLPNGTVGVYDKRHRFAFAGEDRFYTAGNKRLITSVNGWKFNLQICYDLRFPVWARQQSEDTPEFDVLLYVANWPERRSHAWKSLLIARAIENQCYVIGVNRVGKDGNGIEHSGDSMLVDPLGEVLFTQAANEVISTHLLDKDKLAEVRSRFPFWKDADHFNIQH
ncbi:MAG TPA: amidohydrolase [Sediminibacterium sp.]|nr:amidohydrolase [Sediminibacterium sp.]